MPPPFIGPVVARGERGDALAISEEDRLLVMRINVFEIEAIFSTCLYQLFFLPL